MLKNRSLHHLSRRGFIKGLGAASILGATLSSPYALAGIDVGHLGQLVGQCAAIYDLGLMDDAASKAYFKRVYSAWKASSQNTIADFNKSYNRTIDIFKAQTRAGNDRGELISLARKIYPVALYNLSSSIPDPSNAGQRIIQQQQNAEQASTNQYYSKQYNATQLSQGNGWYVQVMRGYTIETCVRTVQEDTVYQRTPSAILYENERDAGLYIGPFSTSSEASKFVDSNIQNYGNLAQYIRNEPFTNDGYFRLYWQSGVRVQQQAEKPKTPSDPRDGVYALITSTIKPTSDEARKSLQKIATEANREKNWEGKSPQYTVVLGVQPNTLAVAIGPVTQAQADEFARLNPGIQTVDVKFSPKQNQQDSKAKISTDSAKNAAKMLSE